MLCSRWSSAPLCIFIWSCNTVKLVEPIKTCLTWIRSISWRNVYNEAEERSIESEKFKSFLKRYMPNVENMSPLNSNRFQCCGSKKICMTGTEEVILKMSNGNFQFHKFMKRYIPSRQKKFLQVYETLWEMKQNTCFLEQCFFSEQRSLNTSLPRIDMS